MPPRQLIQNQKNKTMKRLKTCSGKQSSLRKNCHPNKSHAALKKEILCLKRNCSNLKMQLREQKLEYTALNRKYLNLETEVQQLQLVNTTLKEENRHYEKLIASTEPDIRACMTRMVETSQTLAGLQMAFNRHRSRQQLSKISGSLSKTQPRTHSSSSKCILKHNKNVLNVAPRRKQAVRPMVQGLQIFTNLTIPLQRVSLPSQSSRSRIQVPVVEAPAESEVVSIAVEPERPNSIMFEKHRRNLHFGKNMKSKPKHFGVKKDDSRHSKSDFERTGSVCMVPEMNYDDSSESEPEVKRFLKPIVLIRDFNVPSSKNGVRHVLDKTFSVKTSSLEDETSNQPGVDFHDPLEGTSSMFLGPHSSNKLNSSVKPPVQKRKNYISDSDSDSESSCDNMVVPDRQENTVGSSLKKTGCKPELLPSASSCLNANSSRQVGVSFNSVNYDSIENSSEPNLVGNSNDVKRLRTEPNQKGSGKAESTNVKENEGDVEMHPTSEE